ncbi:hypothetical protein TNCV_3461011 [Trichonephila clavipes]|nr:hypothetical protein TNCV_3461011 [Trichonephila clavipes]
MTPKWSPKMMPTCRYLQDFAKFSLNHPYNVALAPSGGRLLSSEDANLYQILILPKAPKPNRHSRVFYMPMQVKSVEAQILSFWCGDKPWCENAKCGVDRLPQKKKADDRDDAPSAPLPLTGRVHGIDGGAPSEGPVSNSPPPPFQPFLSKIHTFLSEDKQRKR